MTLGRSVQMILAVGALCVGGAADARDMTAAERKGLFYMLGGFTESTLMGAQDRVAGYMPDRLMTLISLKRGVSVSTARTQMAQSAAAAFARAPVLALTFKLDQMREAERNDGEPYVTLPMETIIAPSGTEKRKITSQTVAFMEEGGEWSLMRIATPQHFNALVALYPTFKGADIAPADDQVRLP